jgi:hypothetical protein
MKVKMGWLDMQLGKGDENHRSVFNKHPELGK